MKKYGLRIGNIGVEFVSIEERQKALINFTKGTDVKISTTGIKFSDGEGSFSVYDRDTKEVITTCRKCNGEFSIETCFNREYPYKPSYSDKYSTENGYICEACFAKANKDKELFDARQLLKKGEDSDE